MRVHGQVAHFGLIEGSFRLVVMPQCRLVVHECAEREAAGAGVGEVDALAEARAAAMSSALGELGRREAGQHRRNVLAHELVHLLFHTAYFTVFTVAPMQEECICAFN